MAAPNETHQQDLLELDLPPFLLLLRGHETFTFPFLLLPLCVQTHSCLFLFGQERLHTHLSPASAKLPLPPLVGQIVHPWGGTHVFLFLRNVLRFLLF